MKKFLSLIAAILFAGSMMCSTVVFTKDDFAGQGTANTGSEVTSTKNGVTFFFSKGYCADESLRCYAHGVLIITADTTIDKINFTTTGGKSGGLASEVAVDDTIYQVDDLASQARFTEIKIMLADADTVPDTPIDTTSTDTIIPVDPPVPVEYNYQDTIDFASDIEDFDDWKTAYKKHIVNVEDIEILFDSANHQTSTISNIPVVCKGGSVEAVLTTDKKYFTAVKFICKQWNTKSQTITLLYSTDRGINYLDFEPAITASDFEIECNDLPSDVDAVKIAFSSASNQIGIEKMCFDLVVKSTPTDLLQTQYESKTYKAYDGRQIVIVKGDKTYNILGQRLK